MVAVSILALFIPLKVATPLAVLVSITIALIIVLQDWQKINLRSALGLLSASLFGIPFGLLLLANGGEQIAKAVLANLIILFSLYSLIIKMPPELKKDNLSWLIS